VPAPAEFQEYVPLTGAAAMLAFLLKTWITNSRDRERERKDMIIEHRDAMAAKDTAHRQAMIDAVADKDAHIRHLRERVAEQEAELRASKTGGAA
jgi:hypothetical protein